MKISVNKEYTTLSQLPKVKDDMKEFKARYTDGDLKNVFCDVVENEHEHAFRFYCSDIVSVNVEAFPAGDLLDNETSFSVTMLCRRHGEFLEAHFYCNLGLTVDTRDLTDYRGVSTGKKLYSLDRYVLQ